MEDGGSEEAQQGGRQGSQELSDIDAAERLPEQGGNGLDRISDSLRHMDTQRYARSQLNNTNDIRNTTPAHVPTPQTLTMR